MSNSIRLFGACLLLSGLLAAGCGGEDDGSGGEGAGANVEASNRQTGSAGGGALEPTSESKQEYVAKANALCKERQDQIQSDLKETLESLPSKGAQQTGLSKIFKGVVAPNLEAEAEELRELGAPEGEEEQVEAIVVEIEANVTAMREDPVKFARNPTRYAKAEKRARAYGIGNCGRAA